VGAIKCPRDNNRQLLCTRGAVERGSSSTRASSKQIAGGSVLSVYLQGALSGAPGFLLRSDCVNTDKDKTASQQSRLSVRDPLGALLVGARREFQEKTVHGVPMEWGSSRR